LHNQDGEDQKEVIGSFGGFATLTIVGGLYTFHKLNALLDAFELKMDAQVEVVINTMDARFDAMDHKIDVLSRSEIKSTRESWRTYAGAKFAQSMIQPVL
jgi:hypothetical protein